MMPFGTGEIHSRFSLIQGLRSGVGTAAAGWRAMNMTAIARAGRELAPSCGDAKTTPSDARAHPLELSETV